MKFEGYLKEDQANLKTLTSNLVENYMDTLSLERKVKLLSALTICVGVIFDDDSMVYAGVETLKNTGIYS